MSTFEIMCPTCADHIGESIIVQDLIWCVTKLTTKQNLWEYLKSLFHNHGNTLMLFITDNWQETKTSMYINLKKEEYTITHQIKPAYSLSHRNT